MTDRYRGHPTHTTSRSATHHPARSSVPTNVNYNSPFAGEMHALPTSTRHHTASTAGVPTTTRTYGVTSDPRARVSARDSSRSRRSTLDSASRAPVIVTTTQKGHPAGASHSSNRPTSPIRDDNRPSDSHLYAPSSSTNRSRSTTRPFSSSFDGEDVYRHRETGRDRPDRVLSPRETEAYRSTRPTVVYPSDPRHSHAAIDYGGDGYQYTNAGELARYDLEHTPPIKTRRRESVDRGYHRPNVSYDTDQRSLDVTVSPDLSRNYNMNTSRPYDSGRGPPPSTRGFDKLPRTYEVTSGAAPPSPRGATYADVIPARESREGRRPRPTSMYVEGAPRSSQHDDYYKSREDERTMQELRDRDKESETAHDPRPFRDETIRARGFGIRPDLIPQYDGGRDVRREPRREKTKERSDESLDRTAGRDRDDPRRSRPDDRNELPARREKRRGSDDDEREQPRLRDGTAAAGLGIIGAGAGLASAMGKEDDRDRETRRRRSPDEEQKRLTYAEESGGSSMREVDKTRRSNGDHLPGDYEDEDRARGRTRQESERKSAGGAAVSGSESDRSRSRTRQSKGPPAEFNPNDPSDLKQLKEQLASMDKAGPAGDREKRAPVIIEADRAKSKSPSKESLEDFDGRGSDGSSRGRDSSVPATATRQVRVVSPPRDKNAEKRLRGILKQPKPSFPEDNNPIREGVAPHKEDKKGKEAPPGARWTKINRRAVNPEALTIGKERFEVRDDFVIVLRVLDREEIDAYAAATTVLRERRRKGETRREGDREHHHHHHSKDDDDVDAEDRDRGKRSRHRRKDDEDDDGSRVKEIESASHHQSHRDGERDDRDKERDRNRDRDREREREREKERKDRDR